MCAFMNSVWNINFTCIGLVCGGMMLSTVCEIVHETWNEIVKQLLKTYIKFPQGHELNHVVLTFKRKFGVPQCFGAIDGSHIPICAPVGNHTDFTTEKVGIL